MIITKNNLYTREEIENLREQFSSYIKTVIDIKRRICSAGCNRHFEKGSDNTARRFLEEAIKRKEEIEISEIKPYLKKFIESLPKVLMQKDKRKLAEDALTYSVIFQNYVTKFYLHSNS